MSYLWPVEFITKQTDTIIQLIFMIFIYKIEGARCIKVCVVYYVLRCYANSYDTPI